jgi:hypothetical protein
MRGYLTEGVGHVALTGYVSGETSDTRWPPCTAVSGSGVMDSDDLKVMMDFSTVRSQYAAGSTHGNRAW